MFTKVSVIVPNYNHGAYLRQRIDSILNQTYQDFELILLDDYSTDNSREILESYRDNPHVSHIVFNEKNTGKPFSQWVKGIEIAKGKYVWIAESDDYASPEFLETTVAQLEENPEVRICLTGSYIVDGDNNCIETDEFDKWEEDGKAYMFASEEYMVTHMFDYNSVYNASGVVFRREGAMQGIDMQFKKMRYCGDWLFWIEQIRKGEVVEVHKKLNYFRKHGCNTIMKGEVSGNLNFDVIYIKAKFFSEILKYESKEKLLLDKYFFYRYIKHLSVPKRKKLLLLNALRKNGISFFTYQRGKWLRSYIKHFRGGRILF